MVVPEIGQNEAKKVHEPGGAGFGQAVMPVIPHWKPARSADSKPTRPRYGRLRGRPRWLEILFGGHGHLRRHRVLAIQNGAYCMHDRCDADGTLHLLLRQAACPDDLLVAFHAHAAAVDGGNRE